MTGIVYGLCDPQTMELRYVGKTTRSPRERFRGHLSQSKRSRTIAANWIRSVGRPVMVVLQETDDPETDERRWIADLRAIGARLTNMTDGGTGGATFTGRRHSAASRARMSEAQKGHAGHAFTPEERAHASAIRKGRPHSPEHRAAIGRARLGIPAPNKGKPHSDATKALLSEALRASWDRRLGR